MEQFEEQLHQDLHQFLQSMKEVDERLPECPDVEDKWEQIVKVYIPDGIREFNDFPSASLGWMIYIGMAIANAKNTCSNCRSYNNGYCYYRNEYVSGGSDACGKFEYPR